MVRGSILDEICLMDDIKHINEQLAAFPKQIYTATQNTEELREAWLLAEARKDYESAGAFLKAKTANLTEGQAKAKATEAIYETSMEVIKAESLYRRAFADQTRLENEFVGVRKRCGIQEILLSKGITL